MAIATLRYLIDHRSRLLGNVGRMDEYFQSRLAQMRFKHAVTVRARGLAIGVDVDDEDYASKIRRTCRRAGLLVTNEGATLLLLPSLVIEKSTAARGLDILRASL